ncbi:hypothetical protein [Blastococcus sp. SYSU DS1021]
MWASSGNVPHDAHAERFRLTSPPENEIPVVLPLAAVLGRSDHAAVALTRVAVFSTGVLVDLVVRVRPGAIPMVDLHEMVWRSGDGAPRMLIGVQLADGTRLDNDRRQGPMEDVVFSSQGGSGNEHSVDQGWWLAPLPPPGPVRFVVRCPVLGIEETVTELDGTAIRRAAEDVVELWPWTPPEPAREESGRHPDVPPDSWFAG